MGFIHTKGFISMTRCEALPGTWDCVDEPGKHGKRRSPLWTMPHTIPLLRDAQERGFPWDPKPSDWC